MELKIAHLYPELLNLYSDRGNVVCLQKRCEWRGISAMVTEIQLDDELNLSDVDILILGGGGDREQRLIAERLREFRGEIAEYVESNGVLLALCGGFELLGNFYETAERVEIKGLELIDSHTLHSPNRLIGNVVIESEEFGKIVGFENHAGQTIIGDCAPLGNVIHGFGNNDNGTAAWVEGVIYKNVIGTYLHGPLLPKNPKLADALILKALRRKFGDDVALAELDDSVEIRAHNYIVERFLRGES